MELERHSFLNVDHERKRRSFQRAGLSIWLLCSMTISCSLSIAVALTKHFTYSYKTNLSTFYVVVAKLAHTPWKNTGDSLVLAKLIVSSKVPNINHLISKFWLHISTSLFYCGIGNNVGSGNINESFVGWTKPKNLKFLLYAQSVKIQPSNCWCHQKLVLTTRCFHVLWNLNILLFGFNNHELFFQCYP